MSQIVSFTQRLGKHKKATAEADAPGAAYKSAAPFIQILADTSIALLIRRDELLNDTSMDYIQLTPVQNPNVVNNAEELALLRDRKVKEIEKMDLWQQHQIIDHAREAGIDYMNPTSAFPRGVRLLMKTSVQRSVAS